MIDFTTVTREFRSLVDRRREIFTFLGSAFAAMGLFLTHTLEGSLPASLKPIQERIFAFYALVLMVISLILALRMGKLHAGMALNGVLYAKLMQNQSFTRPGDPAKAARHNLFGVSFLQFVIMDLLAGFSTFILILALGKQPAAAVVVGVGVFVLWALLYLRFHDQAVRFARLKIAAEEPGPVSAHEWKDHISQSMEQANQGLISELAFAGLIVFSCFGAISGMGKIEADRMDLGAGLIREHGPLFFAGMMCAVCLLEMVIYLRIRVAIGFFSLQLDPTDRPFRPLRLTDSFLGYMLLSFLFCVTLHVILSMVPKVGSDTSLMLIIDAGAFILAIAAEKATLLLARRK